MENNPNHHTHVDTVKEEIEIENEVINLDEFLDFDKNGRFSLSESKMGPHKEDEELGLKPFKLLNELGTPPFLTKTYELVENPETDEILSWGGDGFSFVVWDPHKFSTDLLPKYFKHSNFSSFVRQLNTYGFRKVHLDRWEFANASFQKGKKQLLKYIKRKCYGGNNNSRLKFQRDTEIEKLKLEQETMKVEIDDLKQQQLNTNQSLASMEERVKSSEWKQKQFLLFIAKAMKSTPLFQQLLEKYKQKKALENGQVFKRRRLASGEIRDDSFLKDSNQIPGYCPKDDDMVGIQLGANSLFGEQISGLTSETSSSDLSSGNYIMWEKLLEDDVICKEEALDVDQTKFVHELVDLISKPPAFANVGEVACPGGQ